VKRKVPVAAAAKPAQPNTAAPTIAATPSCITDGFIAEAAP
jgi:hypothetical protein